MNLKMQCLNLGIENVDEEISRVLKIVRMEEHKTLKCKKCSLVMKQRVGIALALLGEPALLILDEPTSGLDPVSREEILMIFKYLKLQGVSILFSTHITSDLEKCADEITYIREGEIVYSGSLVAA